MAEQIAKAPGLHLSFVHCQRLATGWLAFFIDGVLKNNCCKRLFHNRLNSVFIVENECYQIMFIMSVLFGFFKAVGLISSFSFVSWLAC